MGDRGELDSVKTFAQHGKKTYFFNFKENRFGDKFVAVVESARRDDGTFNRFQIAVFQEDFEAFKSALTKITDDPSEADGELILDSKNGNRSYAFRARTDKRSRALSISEVKKGEEPNSTRRVRVEWEDVIIFRTGFSRAIVSGARAGDDRPRREFSGERASPRRDFGDRAEGYRPRSFDDRPRSNYGDRSPRDREDSGRFGSRRDEAGSRSFGDRPRSNYSDRSPRDREDSGRFGSRRDEAGSRSFGDRPRSNYSDRSPRDREDSGRFSSRRDEGGSRSFGDRPRAFSASRGPRRDFGDKVKTYGDRDRAPRGEFSPRDDKKFGDRPRSGFSDRPRSFGDRPRSNFGDRAPRDRDGSSRFGPRRDDAGSRSFGDRPRSFSASRAPRRDFGDKARTYGDRDHAPRGEFSPREDGRAGDRLEAYRPRSGADSRGGDRESHSRRPPHKTGPRFVSKTQFRRKHSD